MTHVNNREEMEKEMEPTGERERDRETAAGSGVRHRFLASASERDANSRNALEAAATATTATTATTITNLEDLAFEACQNWSELHQDFFITDDELEYEDELSLGSSIGNIAITTAADAAADAIITGEQQNEQLLMEGAYAITVKSMNPVQCGAIAFFTNTVRRSLS